MEDVLKPEFQQGFDFFGFFGDFDREFVVGSGARVIDKRKCSFYC